MRLPLVLALLVPLLEQTAALDNGLGLLPPQAWRSWKYETPSRAAS